jgi:hypothetical protein
MITRRHVDYGPMRPRVSSSSLAGMHEDRLEGLSDQERAACLVAERVLDAVAEPWDVGGRQGAVDAMLTLPDGRRAAFEVTALANQDALQTVALLGRDDFEWPLPGRWAWSIRIGSRRDIPRLRRAYCHIVLLCEEAGIELPEVIWRNEWNGGLDPDIAWLIEESSSTMRGMSNVPAVEGGEPRMASVMSAGSGGGTDESLAGLRQSLFEAFAMPHMAKHIDKVTRADADERHLFLPIHWTGLPFAVSYGLMFGTVEPPEPPPLTNQVTHLWLAPQYARRVLLWSRAGWSSHYPYDN